METDEKGQGIPLYLEEHEQEIDDPANPPEERLWHAANNITFKLLRCVEGIRDTERLLEILSKQDRPASDRRIIKLLATPLYNLASGTKDLFYELEGNAKEYEDRLTEDQKRLTREHFDRFSTAVPLRDSALRTVRDKISSHIDKDVFTDSPRQIWGLVDLSSFLEWMRSTLDALLFLLSLDVYAWTRESGHPDVFRMMIADGIQIDVLWDEAVLLSVTAVQSPKYAIEKSVRRIASFYKVIMARIREQDEG